MTQPPRALLAQACLRVLALHSPHQAVSRQQLWEYLEADAWVSRNRHRLSRLDSTLAGLSHQQLVELNLGQIRLLPAGLEAAQQLAGASSTSQG